MCEVRPDRDPMSAPTMRIVTVSLVEKHSTGNQDEESTHAMPCCSIVSCVSESESPEC